MAYKINPKSGVLDLRHLRIESEPDLSRWIKEQAVYNHRTIPQQIVFMMKRYMESQLEMEEKIKDGSC